jgi:hypothetical protein
MLVFEMNRRLFFPVIARSIAVSLVLLFSFSVQLPAQSRVGITVGMLKSKLVDGPAVDGDYFSIINPCVALSYQVPLSELFFTDFSIGYQKQGGGLESRGTELFQTETIRLNYLRSEANIEFRPIKKLFLCFGAYSAYLTKSSSRIVIDYTSGFSSASSKVYEGEHSFDKWDYGVQLGLGLTTLSGFRFGLEVSRGIKVVTELPVGSFKNHVVSTYVAYFFPIKKTKSND